VTRGQYLKTRRYTLYALQDIAFLMYHWEGRPLEETLEDSVIKAELDKVTWASYEKVGEEPDCWY
jgi:hypothetical protein